MVVRPRRFHVVAAACLCAIVLFPTAARAQARGQAAARGRLIVTVVDPTGAVLPNATVTVTGLENATKTATIAPAAASAAGVATFEALALGRYSVQAEFSGFETGVVKDVRVRAGDNRASVTLPLRRISDSVTVGNDAQESAADRGVTFGSAFTREQIDALSDDPEEMRRQIQAIAGADAQITVDSFEGAQLPPKSQIKSIRIARDQFAAEKHSAVGFSVEIITQPGIGPLRGGIRTGLYSSALDGRNALVGAKGPGQNRQYGANFGGTLIPNRMSFSLNLNGSNMYSTPSQFIRTSAGLETRFGPRQPRENVGMSGQIDYAVTRDQTIRAAANWSEGNAENMGIGVRDSADRAFSTKNNNFGFRLQEIGPLGRRFFMNHRLSVSSSRMTQVSSVEAPTIVVDESFTSGGAQQAGGTRTRSVSAASDLDYVRGMHSFRAGVLIDVFNYRTDVRSNYLGTYTFENLEAYEAGRPRAYTRRIGDPLIRYTNVQAGVYIQDDIRIRRNLTLTPGLRYEYQNLLDDTLNFAPRFGITWAPFKSGATTLRASAGIFYDWLPTGTYDQTLRIDGFRQQEINLQNPAFPVLPGDEEGTVATNRYLLDDDLVLGRNTRLSLGASQRLQPKLTLNSTYAYTRFSNQLVGNNLNAPVSGLRPDPAFANIIEAVAAGRSIQHSLSVNANLNLSQPSMAGNAAGPLLDFKRNLYVGGGYTLGRNRTNTDGAFAVPATGNLDEEWGPANADVRHNGSISVSSGFLRNLGMSFYLYKSSARPLTVRTGTDDNGDLIFNDRPAGVGRNTLRTSGQFSSYAFFNYTIGLGRRRVNSGTGVMITSQGGALSASTLDSQAVARYRLILSMSVDNLFNTANYGGYVNVISSKDFLTPTSVTGVRTMMFNAQLTF